MIWIIVVIIIIVLLMIYSLYYSKKYRVAYPADLNAILTGARNTQPNSSKGLGNVTVRVLNANTVQYSIAAKDIQPNSVARVVMGPVRDPRGEMCDLIHLNPNLNNDGSVIYTGNQISKNLGENYIKNLLNGNCAMVISNNIYPSGEIRGQIRRGPRLRR